MGKANAEKADGRKKRPLAQIIEKKNIGAPGRTRTCAILLRRYAVQNSKCRCWYRLRGSASFISPLNWTEVGLNGWGEPLRWHKLSGHSFRFHRRILASPSRRRGLGKGTAFESLSPAVP